MKSGNSNPRTYWVQSPSALVYGGSSRYGAPLRGSYSGMSVLSIQQVSEQRAQLISSLTVSGTHKPVIDIDFRASLTQTPRTATVIINPPNLPKRKQLRLLGKNLAACGFTKRASDARFLDNEQGRVLRIQFKSGVKLVPSSTEGHFHLYLEREIPWWRYRWLLLALCRTGVIGKDFCDLSLKNRQSYVRHPREKKISTYA